MSALSRDIEAAQERIALGDPNRTVVLCPSCGGQDWSVEYRVKVAVPAILRLIGMTVEVKDTMIGHPPVPASCVEAFACACGFTIDPAENYFRCHVDGRLVLAGDCCKGCGVHYSEVCDTCLQAGYHANGCAEIVPALDTLAGHGACGADEARRHGCKPLPVSEGVEGPTVLDRVRR